MFDVPWLGRGGPVDALDDPADIRMRKWQMPKDMDNDDDAAAGPATPEEDTDG